MTPPLEQAHACLSSPRCWAGCTLPPAFSSTHKWLPFYDPACHSKKEGDYRNCHTRVIRSGFGVSPPPTGNQCTGSLSAFWIPPTGAAECFIATLGWTWQLQNSAPSCEMCAPAATVPAWLWGWTFPPDFLLLCKCFHFILFLHVGKRKTDSEGNEQGRCSISQPLAQEHCIKMCIPFSLAMLSHNILW